ncbi:MAG: hypothetical protein WA970_01160 [Gammaproteobacteria bacterium]
MGIFEQPHLRRDERGQAVDALVPQVGPFLRAYFAQLDPRVMTTPEKRLAYAHFVFGTIAARATEQGLYETQCLAALVVCLQKTPRFSPLEAVLKPQRAPAEQGARWRGTEV